MLGKELTLLDPKTGLEVKAEDLIEQVAREINNGGLPEKLSVIIPAEQNLPTQFSGKYTLASKKWPPKNGRECWISDGQAPAAYRIFYDPDIRKWAIGRNISGDEKLNNTNPNFFFYQINS